MKVSQKTVFITGVASGIGRATAEKLVEGGHRVLGIDLYPCEISGVVSFVCDVTDEDAVEALAAGLSERSVSLDVIINAAGVHAMCSLVEGEFSKMKRLVEINVCGAMLVNRLFHPLLSGDGRIVIVTSEVAPLDPMPFNGLYSVSKTALDCYAQALRQELNLLGQRVVTVRPGAIETPLARGSLDATERLAENTRLYERQAKHFLSITKRFMGIPMKPEVLARVIVKAALTKRPRLVYSKHRSAGLLLLNILPKRMQCAVIKMLLGRK
ncbi:MAG: SDR family NAD(P)-dependent oxidoreductase [Clostridia bacterium]|nr:SDR family NAD(P)-dependent oxidoreductase [Clostridia bacterium]